MTWEDTDKGIDIDIIVDYIDIYNPMVVLLVYTYEQGWSFGIEYPTRWILNTIRAPFGAWCRVFSMSKHFFLPTLTKKLLVFFSWEGGRTWTWSSTELVGTCVASDLLSRHWTIPMFSVLSLHTHITSAQGCPSWCLGHVLASPAVGKVTDNPSSQSLTWQLASFLC